MTSKPKPKAAAGFIVTLRPNRTMTEDQAGRALRSFLKAALRSYGLRCVSAEPEAAEPSEPTTTTTKEASR